MGWISRGENRGAAVSSECHRIYPNTHPHTHTQTACVEQAMQRWRDSGGGGGGGGAVNGGIASQPKNKVAAADRTHLAHFFMRFEPVEQNTLYRAFARVLIVAETGLRLV